MTEKQIEQLKSLLSESTAEQISGPITGPSRELDQRILDASIELKPSAKNKPNFALDSLLPLNFIRSASAAVAITAVVFIGLGQVISPDESNSGLTSNRPSVDFSVPLKSGPLEIEPEPKKIEPPIVSTQGAAPTSASRDEILMGFSLLNTQEFLADTDIELQSSEQSLSLALADINSMIQFGEFNDARQRYAELKKFCVDCSLPNSLEALVFNANQHRAELGSGTG